MLDRVQTIIASVFSDPLATVIFTLASLFLFILWRATRNENLDWRDLVAAKDTHVVSLTKVLQLIGGVTGTWIMVYLTLHTLLTNEIFFIYLTYVGAIEAWSKFVAARYGGSGGDPPQGKGQPQLPS